MTDDHSGKRFSLVYLSTGEALPDSTRARMRIARAYRAFPFMMVGCGELIERELGVSVPYGQGYDVPKFIETSELRDFLDCIGIIYMFMRDKGTAQTRAAFLNECRRIFSEERLRYVINDNGAVRFAADAAFEMQVQTTLTGLGHPNFGGVRDSFDRALADLSQSPADGKAAIRHMFEAVEIAFKTLCDGAPRIGDAEVKKFLVPKLNDFYSSDETARLVAMKMARSLAEWVDAGHFYRHGQVSPEPVQPPFDLAVAVVSEGIALLRWLAALMTK